MFGDIASKVVNRDGGYTRILKTGNRLGDNAEMCIIELVDFNDTYTTDKPKKKAKSTRRAGAKKAAPEKAAESTEEVKDTKAAPVEAKKDASEKPHVDENPADKAEEKENAKDDAKKSE